MMNISHGAAIWESLCCLGGGKQGRFPEARGILATVFCRGDWRRVAVRPQGVRLDQACGKISAGRADLHLRGTEGQRGRAPDGSARAASGKSKEGQRLRPVVRRRTRSKSGRARRSHGCLARPSTPRAGHGSRPEGRVQDLEERFRGPDHRGEGSAGSPRCNLRGCKRCRAPFGRNGETGLAARRPAKADRCRRRLPARSGPAKG